VLVFYFSLVIVLQTIKLRRPPRPKNPMIDTRDMGNVAADVLLHRPCAKTSSRTPWAMRSLPQRIYVQHRQRAAVVQVLVLTKVELLEPSLTLWQYAWHLSCLWMIHAAFCPVYELDEASNALGV
jgi:hypothetical protein